VTTLGLSFIAVRDDERPRFVRRCVEHHVTLTIINRQRWTHASGDMKCPKGHAVDRWWELYDTVTGRSLICASDGFIDEL